MKNTARVHNVGDELPEWVEYADDAKLPQWPFRDVLMSPELAREIVDSYNTVNRALTPSRVNKYAKEMKANRFPLTPQNVTIAFDTAGILIDGQTRLMAVIESGIPMPMRIYFNVDPNTRTHHDEGKPRSGADAISMEDNVRDPKRMKGYTNIVAPLVARTFSKVDSNEDSVIEFRKHRAAIEWAFDNLYTGAHKAMQPQAPIVGTFAWAYAVMRPEHREVLENLATKVRTGEGLIAKEPAMFIRDLIVEARGQGGSTRTTWQTVARTAMLIEMELRGRTGRNPGLPRAEKDETQSKVICEVIDRVEATLVAKRRRPKKVEPIFPTLG